MVKFVSSNQRKIDNFKLFINKHGEDFEPTKLDLDELQTDNSKDLAIAKALQAFEKVHEALFVNDAGWEIPALNGFPGPYMKYINQWFKPEDFLNLIKEKTDRRIILWDYFACVNKEGKVEVFQESYEATILENPIGEGSSIDRITSFNSIGKAISQISDEDRLKIFGESKVWKEIADWIKSN